MNESSLSYPTLKNKEFNMKKYSFYFAFLLMAIVISDFLSDLMAIQTFSLGFLTFTGGDFVFPIVYIANDVLSEVYGYKTTKKVIWSSLGINVFALTTITCVSYLAGNDTAIYRFIIGDYGFGSAMSVAVAGFTAYLVASRINAFVMHRMRLRHGERLFKTRCLVSTVFGELADSATFCMIGCLLGLYTWDIFLSFTLTIAILKTLVEAICLPITSKIVGKLKKVENDLPRAV